jgi:hypothetical protein
MSGLLITVFITTAFLLSLLSSSLLVGFLRQQLLTVGIYADMLYVRNGILGATAINLTCKVKTYDSDKKIGIYGKIKV